MLTDPYQALAQRSEKPIHRANSFMDALLYIDKRTRDESVKWQSDVGFTVSPHAHPEQPDIPQYFVFSHSELHHFVIKVNENGKGDFDGEYWDIYSLDIKQEIGYAGSA